MPMQIETNLTDSEVYTIWSMFRSSCMRLEDSGDYPEKAQHKKIASKILDIRYQLTHPKAQCTKPGKETQ